MLQWKGPFNVIEKKNGVEYVFDLGHWATRFHINMLKGSGEKGHDKVFPTEAS